MEGHAQKCVERKCELANKKTEQLYTVSSLCLDDHNFQKEELEAVGEMSKTCFQIILKCLFLARIGRLDILWAAKTNLLEESQNGQELVTNVWLV